MEGLDKMHGGGRLVFLARAFMGTKLVFPTTELIYQSTKTDLQIEKQLWISLFFGDNL